MIVALVALVIIVDVWKSSKKKLEKENDNAKIKIDWGDDDV
jgi:hypothetical protein